MAWVSELEYFDDLFRSETQELDVLEEEWTKNRVSDGTKYPFFFLVKKQHYGIFYKIVTRRQRSKLKMCCVAMNGPAGL